MRQSSIEPSQSHDPSIKEWLVAVDDDIGGKGGDRKPGTLEGDYQRTIGGHDLEESWARSHGDSPSPHTHGSGFGKIAKEVGVATSLTSLQRHDPSVNGKAKEWWDGIEQFE